MRPSDFIDAFPIRARLLSASSVELINFKRMQLIFMDGFRNSWSRAKGYCYRLVVIESLNELFFL